MMKRASSAPVAVAAAAVAAAVAGAGAKPAKKSGAEKAGVGAMSPRALLPVDSENYMLRKGSQGARSSHDGGKVPRPAAGGCRIGRFYGGGAAPEAAGPGGGVHVCGLWNGECARLVSFHRNMCWCGALMKGVKIVDEGVEEAYNGPLCCCMCGSLCPTECHACFHVVCAEYSGQHLCQWGSKGRGLPGQVFDREKVSRGKVWGCVWGFCILYRDGDVFYCVEISVFYILLVSV